MSKPRSVWRQVDGIVLLDKPAGVSSNQALQAVRRLFRAEKAGHTGSLDPLATGLLPLCFGEATKIAGLLLGACKAYSARAVLGVTTDTDDADGQPLLTRPVPAITAATLDAALAPLRGRIRQRPPIYSALKQGGEPLYAKARRGEIVEVPEREIDVQRLDAHLHDARTLDLDIECGSGTYVRSLVRDLGEMLGCGAHVLSLRRRWIEPFRQPRMFTLPELQVMAESGLPALDACLLPIEYGLSAWPKLLLDPAGAARLGQGQAVRIDPGDTPPGLVAVFDHSTRILGLARLDDTGVIRAQRLFRWAAIPGATGASPPNGDRGEGDGRPGGGPPAVPVGDPEAT